MEVQREWAKGLSQEEQEEYLADPTTGVLRDALQAQVRNQERRVLSATRTSSLEAIRWEAGFLEGLRALTNWLREDES